MKLKKEFITKNSTSRLYELDVPIIGLTGGISTGKSTVAKFFQDIDVAVISADALVKNIYQTKEAKEFIKTHFPKMINADDSINFKLLRADVFNNEESKIKVESFIYSKLPEEFLKAFNGFSNPELIVYDVPLLFEKGLDQKVDLSVCVYTTSEIQLERLKTRDKIDTELALKIISKQIPIEEKKAKSQFVIDNSKDLNFLKLQFDEFKKQILF